MIRELSVVAIVLITSTFSRGADDIVVADFEGTGYGDWKVTGSAFGNGPAHGTLPNQQEVGGFLGKGLVNTYLNGDGPQGTLTSPEFTVQRKFVNFLLGGGNHPGETCINLLIDGKTVLTATGADDEHLDWRTWDVGEFQGKSARLEIVDRHSGGWGHINVDQIVQSDTRKQEAEEEASVAELYNESYRPQFHFSAKANWLNDPNGLLFYKGEYHLFFQHNPAGIAWGNMTWGHAVSKDLVHWEQLDHALLPDKLGTMFSGSAVIDWDNRSGFQTGPEKVIVLVYTAAGGTSAESNGQPFTQCIAYSNDRGRTFTKYEKNPVLPNVVPGNRDPKLAWYRPARKWIMALYKEKDEFTFFSSPHLLNWEHLQDLKVSGCGECPDFFEMPIEGGKKKKKWVWTAANGHYLIGTFDGQKFTQESGPHAADFGANYYAVQTFAEIPEEDGRRIQIAWMNGGKYPHMPFSQQMSFPCELKLREFPEGLRLCRTPVKEIELLHGARHAWADQILAPGANPLAEISGDLFDIRAEIDLGDATEIGFKLRGQPIVHSVKDKKITCLHRSAELISENNRIKLQILLDRTSIEVFGNDGKLSMTSCFVPKIKDKSVEIFATGGAAKIVSLEVYELKSAWARNKTE